MAALKLDLQGRFGRGTTIWKGRFGIGGGRSKVVLALAEEGAQGDDEQLGWRRSGRDGEKGEERDCRVVIGEGRCID
ncbi:unnamed protein product, partial [Linum tenue]